MSADDPHLAIEGLNVRLGAFALRDVSLACNQGEYHILMGPNGSGKSSLMKAILGFNRVAGGRILVAGRDITRELPERRRMGYVPQNYALFPHLDVERNLRSGIDRRRHTAREADALVARLCGILGIEALRRRKVQNLSGGERQKVALGRALGAQPETILLDEPFSSVEEGRKRGLWFELRGAIQEVGITALHITHNFEEAFTLGERLSVLIDGHLVQSGAKEEIFEQPASVPVARYLNYTNIFTGTARRHEGGTRVETDHFDVVVTRQIPPGQQVTLCVRQADVKIIKESIPVRESLARNVFSGTFVKLFPLTDSCLAWFKVDGSDRDFDLELKFPRHIRDRLDLRPGRAARVAFWQPTIIVLG